MDNISFFDGNQKFKIDKPIRLIELFGGYGSQHFALEYLGVNFEQWKLCEWAVKSIQAYKDAHCQNDNTDYSKDLTKEQIVEFLANKGISADYNKPMTYDQVKRLSEEKLRTIYNNIKATHNLVNIQQAHAKDFEIVDTNKYIYICTYSFPCQDLSKAGLGKGMAKDSGTRSGMLWEVERILDECENLPQVLVMENVPDVIGTKNIEHFAKWLEKLESLGYHCYWQVLNAKDYGVPQNRERCFMVSILGDYYYEFPRPMKLEKRLKDLLENTVAENYHLSDRMIEYFEKHSKECEDKGSGFRFNPVENTEVVAKAVTTRAGARMDDNFIKLKELTSGQSQGNRVYDPNGLSVTINANGGGLGAKTGLYLVGNEPQIFGCMVGTSDDYNKPAKNISKALTTQGKNAVCFVENKYNNFIEKNGYVPEMFNPYNEAEVKNVAPTVTCGCGGVASSATVLIKTATKQGYEEATDGDSVNLAYPESKTRRGRVGKQVAQTLTTSDQIGVYHNYRIRKLTPKECFRLMGVKDQDYEKIAKNQSNTSLYHLAGDSIVVDVLVEIFRRML